MLKEYMQGSILKVKQGGLAQSVILSMIGLTMVACSDKPGNPDHPGLAKLCEPPGTVFMRPGGGTNVLHSVYESPEWIEGDWEVSTLEDESFDPGQIGEMLRAVEGGTFTGIDSILIARNGKLVFEAYFDGFDRDTVHNIRSAFKSFTSTLAGIAIDKELISGVERPVSTYFPDHWADITTDDERRERITLEHLLTMTVGFDRRLGLDDSEDWYRFALDQPMSHEPGTRFDYSDGNSMLIGGAVAQASGEALPDFAKKNLFNPLGITNYCWTLTPAGQPMTDGSFYMRPRDFAKLGQLYLNLGAWQGQRVVSEAWVRDSTRERIALPPPTKRKLHMNYGYQWWVRHLDPGDSLRVAMYAASGGSQKMAVLPNLDMVVVFTGSRYYGWDAHQQPWQLLDRYILPALLE